MKSPLLRVRRAPQVVVDSSFTPLEDAQGDHESSNCCGISIGMVFVLVC
jgi:hypothetical protein